MACVALRTGFDTGRLFLVAREELFSKHCKMKRMLARSIVWHTSCRSRLRVGNAMNMASQAAILEEMEASVASEKNTMRWQRWQAHETMVLIGAKKQQALRNVESTDAESIKSKKTRNKWKEIEAICREKGIDRSAQQCQARWSRLLSAFTQIRSWEETRQPGQPSFWSLAVDERKTMGFLPGLDRKTYDAMVELFSRRVHAMEDASMKEEGSTSERESTNTGGLGNVDSVHEAKRAELLEAEVKELKDTFKEDRGSTNLGNENIEDQSQQITSSTNVGEFRHAFFTPEWECTMKKDLGSTECMHQVHEAERERGLEVLDKEPESIFENDRSPAKLGNGCLEDRKQGKGGVVWHAGSTTKQDNTIGGDFWIDGSSCASKRAEFLDEAAKEMDLTVVKDGRGSEVKSENVSQEDPSWETSTSTEVSDFQHADSTSEKESTIEGIFWSSGSVHEAKRGKLLEVAAELKLTLDDDNGNRIKQDQSQQITSSSVACEFQHAGSTSQMSKKLGVGSVESVHEVKRGEVLDVATKEMAFSMIDDRGVPVRSGTGCIEGSRGETNSCIKGGDELQPMGSSDEQESTSKGDCVGVDSVQDAKIAELFEVAATAPKVIIKDERGSPMKAGRSGCKEKGDQSWEMVSSSSQNDKDVSLAVPGAGIGNVLRSVVQSVRKFFNL